MEAVKAHMRLHGYAGSSEPLQIAYVHNTPKSHALATVGAFNPVCHRLILYQFSQYLQPSCFPSIIIDVSMSDYGQWVLDLENPSVSQL